MIYFEKWCLRSGIGFRNILASYAQTSVLAGLRTSRFVIKFGNIYDKEQQDRF